MELQDMEKMMHSIVEKQFENGLRGTNIHELYEAVDVWKDLCEIHKMRMESTKETSKDLTYM